MNAFDNATESRATVIAFGHINGMNAQPSTDVTPTMRAGHDAMPSDAGHRVGGVRRLTPLECERLMGLPDNWTEGHADSVRYRQCGNAVVVPVAEWIGYLFGEHA